MRSTGFLLFLSALGLGGCFYVGTDDPSPPTYTSYSGGSPSPSPSPTASETPPELLTTGSHDVSEMQASMSAQSDGTSIKVYASLLLNSQFLQTDQGDYFTATIGDTSIVMVQEPHTDDTIHYVATFPAQAAAANVVVAFVRSNGMVGAPYSTVTIPPAFAITSPAPTSFNFGDPLTIVSTLASDTTTVQVTGACLDPSDPVAVSGGTTVTFYTSALSLKYVTGGCDVLVQLRHESQGQVDSAFQRGIARSIPTMAGLQARTFGTSLISQ